MLRRALFVGARPLGIGAPLAKPSGFKLGGGGTAVFDGHSASAVHGLAQLAAFGISAAASASHSFSRRPWRRLVYRRGGANGLAELDGSISRQTARGLLRCMMIAPALGLSHRRRVTDMAAPLSSLRQSGERMCAELDKAARRRATAMDARRALGEVIMELFIGRGLFKHIGKIASNIDGLISE